MYLEEESWIIFYSRDEEHQFLKVFRRFQTSSTPWANIMTIPGSEKKKIYSKFDSSAHLKSYQWAYAYSRSEEQLPLVFQVFFWSHSHRSIFCWAAVFLASKVLWAIFSRARFLSNLEQCDSDIQILASFFEWRAAKLNLKKRNCYVIRL